MKEQLIKTQKQNKKNKKYDTHSLPRPPPHPNPNINEPPSTFPFPHHLHNNKMIMISLAQTRQSDGCGSARNDEIFNLHLGSGVGP